MSNDVENRKVIGAFLKEQREKLGLTPSAIHIATDIPEKEYIQYEAGTLPISDDTLKLFRRLYRVPRKILALAESAKQTSFSRRLTELRTTNGRSQAETSTLLGIAQPTYAGYETGQHEPDIQMLIKIADLYQVSLDYLVDRMGPRG